jgi:nicotinate-nucleotide adenylyltransferase
MNFAIFPGTFNPVHIGHLMIAESACEQFSLEKVKFIVSPFPPNKLNSKDFLDLEKRIKLLELALFNNSKFELDLRETRRPSPSYTSETVVEMLTEITKQTKQSEQKINFIMGVDSFLTLPSWHEAHLLAKSCKFLIASRPGWQKIDVEDSLSVFHDELDWEVIDTPPLSISSTQIRNRKREAKSYRYLLPEKVFDTYKELLI